MPVWLRERINAKLEDFAVGKKAIPRKVRKPHRSRRRAKR
jgi:hypothetical protein